MKWLNALFTLCAISCTIIGADNNKNNVTTSRNYSQLFNPHRVSDDVNMDSSKIVACGGLIRASSGIISSPFFPKSYPPSMKCIWEIIAPPQYHITLNFTHFDLEGNSKCIFDRVEVISKLGDDIVRNHGRFCGSRLPNIIISEGNRLRIYFRSDFSTQRSGFAAVFFTDSPTSNGTTLQHERSIMDTKN